MKKIKFDKLLIQDQNLISEAEKVIRNAYDPYSHFYVGSALITRLGNVYKGVNINTCAYGGLCAERSAISQMITAGEYHIKTLAIISKSDFFKVKIHSGPCGVCRQFLWEFSELIKEDIKILISDSDKHIILITSIKELHPLGFGPRLCFGDYNQYLK